MRGPQDTSRRHVGMLVVSVVALFLSACPEATTTPEQLDQPTLISRGIITAALNRYVDTGTSTPFEQFSLLGIFARYDVEKSATVETLLDGSLADVDLALDTCSMPAPVLHNSPAQETDGRTTIELLDVGNLEVTYDNITRPIPTRTFPDLLKMIVGVWYTADETKGVLFKPGETYALRASGTADIARFQVELKAPQDLGDVKVDGVTPGEQIPLLRREEEIELTWDGDDYGDDIIAELSWTRMGAPWSMTCHLRDNGVFVIPSIYTSELPDPQTSSDEELVLSRIRQMSFHHSSSLSSITYRFVVSTNFPVNFI